MCRCRNRTIIGYNGAPIQTLLDETEKADDYQRVLACKVFIWAQFYRPCFLNHEKQINVSLNNQMPLEK